MKIKNLVITVLVFTTFMITSCISIGTNKVTPCVIDRFDGTQVELQQLCAEFEADGLKSYICDLKVNYDLDACYLHRGLEVIVKEGLILEGYTAEEFQEWGDDLKILVKKGLTYGTLKSVFLAQFTKINKLAGAQILILGDMFLELPQTELIPITDVELVLSSIDDLVQEVKALDMWL